MIRGIYADEQVLECPVMMQWTAPTTGISICQISVSIDEHPMSEIGYKRRFRPPLAYARTTPDNRHLQPNFRFLGFSSAVPSASEVDGTPGERGLLTRKRHWVSACGAMSIPILSCPLQ